MAKPSVKRAATEQTPIEKPVVETTKPVVEKLPDTPIGDDTPAVSSEQVQQLLETQTEATDVKGPEITPEQVQEFGNQVPMKRAGQPAEISGCE